MAHTRFLHTSRPYVNRRNTDTKSKPSFRRHDARPSPQMTVESFKPASKPRPSAVAGLLSRRLDEWSRSARTAKKIEAYRIPPDLSRKALRAWAQEASRALEGLKTDEEAIRGMEELGYDHERLLLAVADENFSDILESAYLRNFLERIVASNSLSSSTRTHIQAILEATDLTHLPSQFDFVSARALTRHFHLHIGPTNSGKTYSALKSLSRAKTGAYAGPLRLLAHEVWERMNLGTVGGMEEGQGRECNLLTGEERRIVNPDAGLISCTVEMLPLGTVGGPYEVVVIDEIQMLGDAQRGGSWTAAVLGVQAKEIHLCGDETTVQLLQSLLEPMGDKVTVHNYDRLTPLTVANESLEGDYSNIQPGDCVVTFSRSNIFAVKKQIESTAGKKCAVVYGALPPETRADQARDFNDEDGRAQVLVASDAVGMGLNL
jgi:ATP-dependent RNA helicase SUPV3L1/SUV3